jgi:hypothetical protein
MTMSESGDISEFGYIMELLAKGKVSAPARACAMNLPHPTLDTTCPGGYARDPGFSSSPRGGSGPEFPVLRSPSRAPAAAECKVGAFSSWRGIPDRSGGMMSGAFAASRGQRERQPRVWTWGQEQGVGQRQGGVDRTLRLPKPGDLERAISRVQALEAEGGSHPPEREGSGN